MKAIIEQNTNGTFEYRIFDNDDLVVDVSLEYLSHGQCFKDAKIAFARFSTRR